MVSCGANMFVKVRMTVVVVALIDVEDALPVSCTVGAQSGVVIDMLAVTVTGVASGLGITVVIGVDLSICAATMIALESMPILASAEEAFRFRSCIWSSADAWNCRVLQAWMPSCHV